MKTNHGRWRCLTTGCNPTLNITTAQNHHTRTGHRVAAWPVRSAAGKAKARNRNRTGYYDKYNVGPKSASNRGLIPQREESYINEYSNDYGDRT